MYILVDRRLEVISFRFFFETYMERRSNHVAFEHGFSNLHTSLESGLAETNNVVGASVVLNVCWTGRCLIAG